MGAMRHLSGSPRGGRSPRGILPTCCCSMVTWNVDQSGLVGHQSPPAARCGPPDVCRAGPRGNPLAVCRHLQGVRLRIVGPLDGDCAGRRGCGPLDASLYPCCGCVLRPGLSVILAAADRLAGIVGGLAWPLDVEGLPDVWQVVADLVARGAACGVPRWDGTARWSRSPLDDRQSPGEPAAPRCGPPASLVVTCGCSTRSVLGPVSKWWLWGPSMQVPEGVGWSCRVMCAVRSSASGWLV